MNTNTPSTEDLKKNYGYHLAQKIVEGLLHAELISHDEYVKISLLNRKKFSPYLVEIMPKLT